MLHTWTKSYTLGALLKERREQRGIARTKMAAILGISHSALVKFEMAGEPEGKIPSVVVLAKICEFLEIDPRDAFDAVVDWPRLNPVQSADEFIVSKHFSFGSHFKNIKDGWKLDYLANEVSSTKYEVGYMVEDIWKEVKSIREGLGLPKPPKDNGPNLEGSDRMSDPDHSEAAPTASVSTRPQRPEENSE